MYLNGEGNHAAHAVGEAGHGLAHPLCVADHHQLCPLKPVLVAQQGVPEAHAACNAFIHLMYSFVLECSRTVISSAAA